MRRSWGRVCLALTGPAGRLPGKAEDGRGGAENVVREQGGPDRHGAFEYTISSPHLRIDTLNNEPI